MELLYNILIWLCTIILIGNCQDVTYFLYTKSNPTNAIELKENSTTVNPNLYTKMIIHGWTEDSAVYWYKDMIGEYLKKGDYNVIAIDWSKKSKANYVESILAISNIAATISKFIVSLGICNKTHIVGHSLGAHIAGTIGKHIYTKLGSRVPRITALDPAGPLFEIIPAVDHITLNQQDANFVDAIHTDGGVFGFKSSIGHVDFFPNSGSSLQPGCPALPQRVKDIFCSHHMSHVYFTESINSNKLSARLCNSWKSYQKHLCDKNQEVIFGENVNTNAFGDFYLAIDVAQLQFGWK